MGNSRFEILLLKLFNLKQTKPNTSSYYRKKSNFYFPRKQSSVSLDKELCKTKAIQTDLCTFRHNQVYPGIIQAYSVIFKTLCNPGIFRTLVYPKPWHIQNQKHIQSLGIFPTLVYLEPPYILNAGIFKIRGILRRCQTSTRKSFAKIVNGYNYFRKL